MRRALPCALFGALTLAAFWKFIFLGQTLYDVRLLEAHLGAAPEKPRGFAAHRPVPRRGDTLLSLPMLNEICNEGLKNGELRLWNPRLFCGYPLYNNLLVHPFYPPNLILHAALPPQIAYDLNLLLHFFFSGAAMYGLLRGLKRSAAGAVAGAVLWMLAGYNMLWFSSGTFMGASVFAPLAMLGLTRAIERRERLPAALAGAAMGLVILGSHGQHALHLLILLSAGLLVAWGRDREARPFVARAGGLFLLATLGVGMAAILTQLDSVLNGLRAAGQDKALLYAHPWTLVTHLSGVAIGKVWDLPNDLLRSEFTIYAGVTGTALALTGAVRGFRDPQVRLLALFAAGSLLVAFLRPLAELALLVPFLNLSMPSRWVYVFGFCASILAAYGVDALAERPGRMPRLLAGGALLFVLLCCSGIGRFRFSDGAAIETMTGLLLAVAAAAALPRWKELAAGLALAALLFDLLPGFLCFNGHADPAPLRATTPAVAGISDAGPWRATGSVRNPDAPAPRADGWTVSIGNNLLALHGVETVAGYDSIAPMTSVLYARLAGGSVMGSGRVVALGSLDSPLLDAANLKYVFMPFDYEPGGRYRRLASWEPLRLYENTGALPRAYVARQTRAARDLDHAVELLHSTPLARQEAILEMPSVPSLHPETRGTISWKERSTDRIALEVDATHDAVVVVSDTWYPGWEAAVDGSPVPIHRANVAFRAVEVPAGRHTVTMRFRPSSARTGLWVTGLSMLAVLAGVVRKSLHRPAAAGVY